MLLVINRSPLGARASKSSAIYGFPPDLGGEGKWQRSEHAHASYPGLSLLARGFNPYIAHGEGRIQELD